MSDAVGMSFKARMNNLAKELGLRPQTVIQNFMFERFLDRLARSQYRDNFVVKGGVLISAMIGLSARATMDMDATAIDLPMTHWCFRLLWNEDPERCYVHLLKTRFHLSSEEVRDFLDISSAANVDQIFSRSVKFMRSAWPRLDRPNG